MASACAVCTALPNFTTIGHVDDYPEPLVADRACELAIECWSLRGNIRDKEETNIKLRSVIKRLKFAINRSTESYKQLEVQNSDLEKTVVSLTSENMKLQNELLEEKSTSRFHQRVVENHKSTILKLKENLPDENGTSRKGRNAMSNKEMNSLKQKLEDLESKMLEYEEYKKSVQMKSIQLQKENQKLQSTVRRLDSDMSLMESTLQTERVKVKELMHIQHNQLSQHQDGSRQSSKASEGAGIDSEAYSGLELAYEELHSKYEELWAEKSRAKTLVSLFQRQRDYVMEEARRYGLNISIEDLPSASLPEEEDDSSDCSDQSVKYFQDEEDYESYEM